jgi:hypothetical protein
MAAPTRHGKIPHAPITAEDKVCLASVISPAHCLPLSTEEPNHFNAFIFYCFVPKNEFCCTPQGTLEAGVTGRNTSCCTDEDLVFKADAPVKAGTAVAVLPQLTTSSASSSTASSSGSNQASSTSTAAVTSTSSSSTSMPTAAPASSESSGMSSGAKAGLGVGITLAVLVILAIIAAVILRRRKPNPHSDAVLLSDSKSDPPPYVTYESAGTTRAELDGTMLPAEMQSHSDKTNSIHNVSRELGTTTPTKEEIAAQKHS